MSSLEEYARRSAADAAESVDRLTAPDLHHGPSAAARLTLATVAIAVLALVGFAVLRGGDATESIDAVTQSPEDNSEARATAADATAAPTYYAPPIDPDGQVFAADRADRGVPDPSEVPDAFFDIYGAGDDLDPLAGGYLVAAILPNGDRENGVDDEFTVRGVPGAQIDGFPDAGSVGIEWQEPDGPLVQLVADVFTVDELVEIADSLDVSADGVALTEPPPGMRIWVEDGNLQDLAPTTVGWILSAVEPGQTTPRTLQGTPGGEATPLLQRIIFNATEPIDINGRTGYRSPAQRFEPTAIVWAVDGMVLSLLVDMDEEDPVGIARSVAPLTDDEWAALVDHSADPTRFGEAGVDRSALMIDELIDTGTTEAGDATWTLYLSTERAFCLDVIGPDASSNSCTQFDDTDRDELVVISMPLPASDSLYGTVGDDVAEVILVTDQGEVAVQLHAVRGQQVFGVVLEPGETPMQVQALDGDGGLVDAEPWLR